MICGNCGESFDAGNADGRYGHFCGSTEADLDATETDLCVRLEGVVAEFHRGIDRLERLQREREMHDRIELESR